MAEAFGLSCCPLGLVPESMLSHRPRPTTVWFPNSAITSGKNTGFQPKKQLGYNLEKHEINTMCCNKYA